MNKTRPLLLMLCGISSWGCQDPAAAPPRIVIDGTMSDWSTLEPVAGQALDASESARPALGRLWVSHDERSLLLRFEVTPETNLQVDNDLSLCLDTDGDAATGQLVNGLGAELCWRFGERRGTFVTPEGATEVEHQHIGLVSAPTVTGTDFEMSLALDAEPVAGYQLFPGTEVRLVVGNGQGDWLPASAGGARYAIAGPVPPPLAPIDIARMRPDHVRFLSYNLNNHLTDPARRAALSRILNAIDADVLLLQEIRDTPTDEAVAYVLSLLDRGREEWNTVTIGGESTLVFSKFPILRADSLGDSGALLLDLEPGAEEDVNRQGVMLLIAMSLPCCNEQARRSEEADLLASYVRDAKSGSGALAIPRGTPIVMMGDANLVGLARDRRALQDGTIVDVATYGPGAPPDWDGTSLADLVPHITHLPQAFTWYGEDFPPGRLDYLFYSDSELVIANRFVLYTPAVPEETLRAWGLEASDTDVVTDHLPVVADLVLVGEGDQEA